MMNIASLLGQFYPIGSKSSLRSLLENDSLSLEQLLEHEQLLNQYKSPLTGTKLKEYLTYDKFDQMLNYVVKVGQKEDQLKSYKFPLTVSQLLSSQNSYMIDMFICEENLLTITEIVQEEIDIDIEPQIIQEKTVIKQQENKQQQQILESQQRNQKQQKHCQIKQKYLIELQKQDLKQKIQNKQQQQQKDQQNQNNKIKKIQINLSNIKKQQQQQNIGDFSNKLPIIQNELLEIDQQNIDDDEFGQYIASNNNQIKNIKKKKIVKKIYHRQVKPLIYKLFSYFQGEINYTLAAYVSQIFLYLISKKMDKVMKWLLNVDRHIKIIKHIESRSVAQLLQKILTNDDGTEQILIILIQEKYILFQAIVKQLSNHTTQQHIISNVATCLCQILETIGSKALGLVPSLINYPQPAPISIAVAPVQVSLTIKKLHQKYFSFPILNILINNIISQSQILSQYNFLVLKTYLQYCRHFQSLQLWNSLSMLISGIYSKLRQCITQVQKLSSAKIRMLQIMVILLNQDTNQCEKIMCIKDNEISIFDTLFQLYRQYELSNILHNQINKIIQKILLQPEQCSLQQQLLNKSKLIEFIIQQIEQDKLHHAYNKPKKAYIGHLIRLVKIMKEQASKNSSLQKICQNKKFDQMIQEQLEPQIHQQNHSLAGFALTKNTSHQIMFHKDDIIANYIGFLSSTPQPIYKNSTQKIQQELRQQNPILLQQLMQQLEIEERKQSENIDNILESINTAENNPQKWILHLQYDINELIIDLE